MAGVSNQTRQKKAEGYIPSGALARWVDELAEASGHTKEYVCEMALVRLERERIEKGE